MVIRVEQGIQKIAANSFDIFKTDEIIDALNVAQERYIKESVDLIDPTNPEGRFNQRSLDKIRTIIRKNLKVQPLVPTNEEIGPDGYIYEDKMSYVTLPENYMQLLSANALITYAPEDTCQTLNIQVRQNAYKEYIAVVPYNADLIRDCKTNFKLNIRLKSALKDDNTYGDIEIFDSADYPQLKNIKKDEDKFNIINVIQETLNSKNSTSELYNKSFSNSYNDSYDKSQEFISDNGTYFNIYWEEYKDKYFKDCFIFVTTDRVKVAPEGDFSVTKVTLNRRSSSEGTFYIEGTGFTTGVPVIYIGDMRIVSGIQVVSDTRIQLTVDLMDEIYANIHSTVGSKQIKIVNGLKTFRVNYYNVITVGSIGQMSNYLDISGTDFYGVYVELTTNESLSTYDDFTNIQAITDYYVPGRVRGQFLQESYAIDDIGDTVDTTKIKTRRVNTRMMIVKRLNIALDSVLMNTTKYSPLTTLAHKYLFLYRTDDFIINSVLLDYVKFPRPISLTFNQSCELPNQSHQEIVDMAIAYLQKSIQDPSYQLTVQDNKLNNE